MSNPETIPKKTEFKLAANLSDLKRVADILGCTPDKIKETLTTSSQATKTYLKAVGEQLLTDETKLQKYFDTIERLEGQLPVSSRKDFTSKETLDQSVSDSLVVTLGIRAVVNSEIASVLKGHGVTDTNGVIARLKDAKNDQETRDILKAAGVTEDQLQETLQKTKTAEQEAIKNKLLEAGIGNDSKVRNLIQMRLLLNIHEKVNLEELEEKKLQAKLEELEKKEKEFAKLAEDYGTSDKTLKNAIKSNQVVLSEKKLEKLTGWRVS